jgi:integrase/recombinase XerD
MCFFGIHILTFSTKLQKSHLVWIRDLLGHSSIQTTEIYARADSKQKREAIEKASENLTPSDVIGEWVDNNDLISWLKGLGKK